METEKLNLAALEPRLLEAVRAIAERVRAAGGRAWLVGGAVRDLLLGGIPVKDVDLEVFGLAPERLKEVVGEAFAFDACGLSFGVLKIKHHAIDVSLPRRESKRGTGHRGFLIDADPNLSVAEAASRRDFTINALYYDPLAGCFEDPFGGADDLRNGVLRHVSPKFVEDPLRVLRGMQFIARFGLKPAWETVGVCRRMTIEGLPPERLFEEWAKLLTKGVHIGRGLAFLRRTAWVKYFPELAALIGCKQDPAWHPEGSVWNHTCLCLDAFARQRDARGRDAAEDIVVGLAVLCHDFGKPATTRFDRATKHIRALGHDVAGVRPTQSFLRRLTGETRLLREVPSLVREHMQPHSLWKGKAGDAAIRRLSARVRIDRLIRVEQADAEGRPASSNETFEGEDLKWLAAAAERLRVAEAAPKPILMGRHLIEMGYRPSPEFKTWLDACYEAQLDGAFAELKGARSYFKSHFAPKPATDV
ncbi:MAG: CCA tRNA nucleotidyltransferase [Kiritimatiellia bacterium]